LAATAGLYLADVFDHTDLHRHEFKLLADFFAEGVNSAKAARASMVFRKATGLG
jgi:hypothetical protein